MAFPKPYGKIIFRLYTAVFWIAPLLSCGLWHHNIFSLGQYIPHNGVSQKTKTTHNIMNWTLRFSQLCSSLVKSPGMWHGAVGWRVPYVLKGHSAFIFRVKLHPEVECTVMLSDTGNHCPVTQHHIRRNLNLHYDFSLKILRFNIWIFWHQWFKTSNIIINQPATN